MEKEVFKITRSVYKVADSENEEIVFDFDSQPISCTCGKAECEHIQTVRKYIFWSDEVANLTVTEEDVFRALEGRNQPKDWRRLIEYLSEHLADALDQHVYDEIRYLADAYEDQDMEETKEDVPF